MLTPCVGLLGLFLIATTAQSAFGWQQINCLFRDSRTVCYTVDDKPMNITTAHTTCIQRHRNGRLATIRNRDEQHGIDIHLDHHHSYLIGARLKRLQLWTWINGSTDVDWLLKLHGEAGRVDDVTIRYAKIRVEADRFEQNLIPEFDTPSGVNENALCQAPCEGQQSACYFVENATNWHSARNRCLLKHGDLATLSNTSFHDLRNKSVIVPGYYFVGLRNTTFEWQGTSDEVKYTNWANLDTRNGAECVSLTPDVNKTSKWVAVQCSTNRRFICEYEFNSSSVPVSTHPLPHVLPDVSERRETTATPAHTSNQSEKSAEEEPVERKSMDPLHIVIVGVLLSLVVIVVVIIIIICVVCRRRTATLSAASGLILVDKNNTPQSYDRIQKNNNGNAENQTTDLTYATITLQPTDGTTAGGDKLKEAHASKQDMKKTKQDKTNKSKTPPGSETVPPVAAAPDGTVYASIMSASAASQQHEETNEYEVPVPNVVYASLDCQ